MRGIRRAPDQTRLPRIDKAPAMTERRRLTTLTDAHEYSNRELLLDIALKLHTVEMKLDVHLASHALLSKVLTVAFAPIVAALIALYLRH